MPEDRRPSHPPNHARAQCVRPHSRRSVAPRTCRRRVVRGYLIQQVVHECADISMHDVVDARPCANCRDGCVVAVYCDGCWEFLCQSCWREHNEDAPDHESLLG